jgi:subtilisin family serine protease
VAGIVALVRAAHPSLDAANVINRVLMTATPVTSTRPDPLYGYGLVDAYQAVVADVPAVSANPLGSIDEWVTIYRRGDDEQVVYPLGPIAPPELPTPRIVESSAAGADRQGADVIAWSMAGALVVALLAIGILGTLSVRRALRKSVD